MAIKRKGVMAVPGIYKYGDLVEIKTAKELKDAAERYPIIPLTMGHPMDGFPMAREQIGTFQQKWDEKNQRVIGEAWFHSEKISDTLRQRLEAYEPIPISAGFLLDSVDADGTQHGISYTHIAILEGEDPKCPLGKCGINIRMESNPDKLVRYEQATDLEVPEKEQEETPETEEILKPDVVSVEPETEIPKTEEPAEENPEEDVEEPDDEEDIKLVPEVIIPIGVTVPEEWEVDERGWITFYPHKRKKEK